LGKRLAPSQAKSPLVANTPKLIEAYKDLAIMSTVLHHQHKMHLNVKREGL
jgi:hypothetical protein